MLTDYSIYHFPMQNYLKSTSKTSSASTRPNISLISSIAFLKCSHEMSTLLSSRYSSNNYLHTYNLSKYLYLVKYISSLLSLKIPYSCWRVVVRFFISWSMSSSLCADTIAFIAALFPCIYTYICLFLTDEGSLSALLTIIYVLSKRLMSSSY